MPLDELDEKKLIKIFSDKLKKGVIPQAEAEKFFASWVAPRKVNKMVLNPWKVVIPMTMNLQYAMKVVWYFEGKAKKIVESSIVNKQIILPGIVYGKSTIRQLGFRSEPLYEQVMKRVQSFARACSVEEVLLLTATLSREHRMVDDYNEEQIENLKLCIPYQYDTMKYFNVLTTMKPINDQVLKICSSFDHFGHVPRLGSESIKQRLDLDSEVLYVLKDYEDEVN